MELDFPENYLRIFLAIFCIYSLYIYIYLKRKLCAASEASEVMIFSMIHIYEARGYLYRKI